MSYKENLNKLLGQYANHDLVKKIGNAIDQDRIVIGQIEGHIGSQMALILASVYNLTPHHHLFIAKDKESAGYFQNDLQAIFEHKSILFFPDSFKHPFQFSKLNKNNIQERTETVNQLFHPVKNGEIVVTYPEALFEKVVAPEQLTKQQIHISNGEILDLPILVDLLLEFKFERTDFVYEPGQFSLRGSIIDIFSYGNEWPYRIELFDDEVERIQTFDPISQLSKRNISKLNIIPNVNQNTDDLKKIPVFESIHKNTVIWIEDFEIFKEKLVLGDEKLKEVDMRVKSDNEALKNALLKDNFIDSAALVDYLDNKNLFFLSNKGIPIKTDLQIMFETKPQPSFNKNFKLLISNIRKHNENNYQVNIFVSNPKQIERFYAIFEDLDANIEFTPLIIPISKGFIDHQLKIACYTDHQIFGRFHRYNLRKGFTKSKAISLKMLKSLQVGDFVTHIDHGLGKFSGLEKLEVNGRSQESIRIRYKNNDILYVSVNALHKISKYGSSEGRVPVLSKLGSDKWKNLKRKTKSKVKDIAKELIKLYAKRKEQPGFAFQKDDYLQNELEASFLYEDTPDQYQASEDVKKDMMSDSPMDRLVCGDVGFGKTEIAIRAAFKCIMGGKQVAILVPTTILALQHYKTFNERLSGFGVEIDYINRFKTMKQKKEIFEKLKRGKLDMVIGTHGILSKDIGFKDLGLLVIDEEQKFGVAAKEKLRNIKVNVDTLTLTATPIPRTLQFSLLGARDLSVIRTAPPNRQPIHTENRVFNLDLIREAISYEVNRGGQVFFVHNRVKNLPEIAGMIQNLVPDVDVAMAHGQMESKNLERTLLDFIDKRYDVLVSTNIIETGLDIPNANTIIINDAHHFGMSDLHQLRGRVGRSNKKAFCYLFSPARSILTPEARKRLTALEEFSDLGSGMNIAMKDLDIRGAGNLLGGEQSGFMADIGYETFQRILEEAVQELRENEFKGMFKDENKKIEYVRDVEVNTQEEMLIPSDYIESSNERLLIYSKIDNLESEEEIQIIKTELEDRFGKIPFEVENLLKGLKLRWICKKLGFEKLVIKNDKLLCFFVSNPQSSFYETDFFHKFLQFMANYGGQIGLSFKKTSKHFFLKHENTATIEDASILLTQLEEALVK